MTRIVRHGALLVALALLVVAGSALASPGHKAAKAVKAKADAAHVKKAAAPEPAGTTEAAGAPESAADDAAQAAACRKAGIDPNGNVNFDDATGTCTLDAGGQSGN